ncbi:hypothetical protein OOT46_27020 [Aquabacterium sp. A7-Y]|uniref:hypothetical protein n=1 Tax=Aquabacterium sp. A7-Y TaxID=1349605 RepID=UPI00223CC207|nr:hypothetical protein [Aquabacterium sp. A7-Y]MCW7541466.1 hypothetical protein [Aquabacterium sp. A7-Y]
MLMRAREPIPEPVSEWELEIEIGRHLRRVTTVDLLDELVDAEASLTHAIDAGNPLVIGKIVLDVRRHLAMRRACYWLYSGEVQLASVADVAAAALICGRS